MGKILLVEDDVSLRKGIIYGLALKDFEIIECGTLKEAKEQLNSDLFQLLLLDVNLPDGSGFDLCEDVRRTSSVPIILLTARDLEMDIVTGLGLGADDYITKPFSLTILRARVEAILRRSDLQQRKFYQFSELMFDFENLTFSKNGQPLALTKNDIKLLKVFCANPNRTLERHYLEELLWSIDSDFIDENALSVTVKRLRDKLGGNSDISIKTVYGIGYRWEVKI
ncbi:response regulator transcription factor [Vagococcus elongatus]|uniref:DNA-binding response regulator n=1 Tax=Vagococcus elongatus TaxID=180344 RepID=A0A430AZX5_9ENTE|nr:response regulator transcription factor [Vagococcus elongatus]RSU13552.1 hypothetical protein CBF29_04685 [Vagococcus elongatus]